MPRDTPRFDLAALTFVESDADTIRSQILTKYQEITGRTLADADPIRLFLLSLAAVIIQLRADFDLAAKENLLSYATGDHLDALGAYVNAERLPATGSVVTLRFTLTSAVTGSVFQIPQGTEVTDGTYTFATDELTLIEVGGTYADVTATAEVTGTATNGIAIGAISQMVEPIAGVATVANLDVSSGGSDAEADDDYADRIRLAPASFSVAGPHDAYEYHAYSFSSSIIDVSVYGLETEPGNVYIRPLLTDGVIPGESFLNELYEYLSAETIRPLTDNVIVQAPGAIDYKINFKWYLSESDLSKTDQIKAAVTAAVEEYRVWQQTKVGRDINPDNLIKLVIAAGAKRLEITEPVFTVVSSENVAQCAAEDVTIEFAGTEEG